MTAPAGNLDPLTMLGDDRERARQRADPCANLCTLATVDAAGHPQARTVVLRELEGRFAVFCNQTSPKWRELEHSPTLAVVVLLPSLDLQYRLQCSTRPVAKPLLHASWSLRPDVPKRLDWFYTRVQPQSSAIDDRDALVDGVTNLRLRNPLTAPRTAAGLYLEPSWVERLDLAAADGIHDRRGYRRHADGWREVILVP